jgi:hypothetical protein
MSIVRAIDLLPEFKKRYRVDDSEIKKCGFIPACTSNVIAIMLHSGENIIFHYNDDNDWSIDAAMTFIRDFELVEDLQDTVAGEHGSYHEPSEIFISEDSIYDEMDEEYVAYESEEISPRFIYALPSDYTKFDFDHRFYYSIRDVRCMTECIDLCTFINNELNIIPSVLESIPFAYIIDNVKKRIYSINMEGK